MKKLTVIFLLVIMLLSPVFAENSVEANREDGKIALGMQGLMGAFSMVGLSYQQWFGNSGITISAGLDNQHINALAEYQYCVYASGLTDNLNSRLYVWAAGGVNLRNDSIYNSTTNQSHDEFHVNAIAALGIGIEFVWWNHLSIPVQFGYIAEMPYDVEMSFCVSTGVCYRF